MADASVGADVDTAGAGSEAAGAMREEIPKEISAKVALLMKMFDEDKDNYLNQKEMSALSNKTSASGDEGTMGDEEWQMLCQLLGADHKVGLRWTDLIVVYTKLADSLGADLSRDFEICFPNQALARR